MPAISGILEAMKSKLAQRHDAGEYPKIWKIVSALSKWEVIEMAGANSQASSITRRVGDCRSEFEVERSLEPPSAVFLCGWHRKDS